MNVRHVALGVLGLLGASVAAQAQGLDDLEAREIIEPWHGLFTVATRGDVKATQEAVLTPDYESCAGCLPSECRGRDATRRDATIEVVHGFAKSIPDMRFDMEDVLVSGNRVVVRGELTGTPAGDLFGAPRTGKGFRMMTINIRTIRDGRIARTFHVENWLRTLRQVRAERPAALRPKVTGAAGAASGTSGWAPCPRRPRASPEHRRPCSTRLRGVPSASDTGTRP